MENFVAIDFEIANAKRTSICSIGIVVVENGEIVDRFYSLVRPQPNFYHWYCSKIIKLSRKDTDNAPLFPEVWKQIAPKIKDYPFIAHNSAFEESCLKLTFQYYKMKYPKYSFFCTEEASRKKFLEIENYKLNTVAAHCGFDLENHHNALADAEACAVIGLNVFAE